uniref:5'-3' exoribonuclease 1 n=1 Tax=Heterorhabditis bacteriophora TaxID=37862 RepID=A0A1I7XBF7_HETBA
MNGIIHNCSHPNDDDVTFRITEEQIFEDVFAYIEKLFLIIRPRKVFFMAIDGVAPRAKMNQQRARRFMSARTAQEQLDRAKKKGQDIPNEKRFDPNCITPGTYFMTELHKRLSLWVENKVNSDPTWQGLRIYISGHDCPGEGEHKIMDFIRAERSVDGYDPNTRHCMYGLDADLLMLGICSHEPHFSLLREEVKFNRPIRTVKGKKREHIKRDNPSEITFHLLHLSLLREYLAWEFHPVKIFLKAFARNDQRCFLQSMEDADFMRSKTNKMHEDLVDEDNLVAFQDWNISDSSTSTEELSTETSESDAAFVSSDEEEEVGQTAVDNTNVLADFDPIEDEFSEALSLAHFKEMDDKDFENDVQNCWTKTTSNLFRRHKRDYYKEKMKRSCVNKQKVMYEQYSGIFIIIIMDVCLGIGLFVLHLLFTEELMCNSESPIADFYPTDFETDLNGKKNDWEAVVLIPFIDEKRLLEAINSLSNKLSEEENCRNTHGGHLLFTWDVSKKSGERTTYFIWVLYSGYM